MDKEIDEITTLLEDCYVSVKKELEGQNVDIFGTMLFFSPPKRNSPFLIFGQNPEGEKDYRFEVSNENNKKENENAFIEGNRSCILGKGSKFDMGVIKLFCLAYHESNERKCWSKNVKIKNDCPGAEIIENHAVIANIVPFRTNKNWESLKKFLSKESPNSSITNGEKYCIPIIERLISYTNPKVIVILGRDTKHFFDKWFNQKIDSLKIDVCNIYHPASRINDGQWRVEAKKISSKLSYDQINKL